MAAYDKAGNVSTISTIDATTVTCASTIDTQSPTAPQILTVSSVQQSGGTIAWTAAADNVGVAGYGFYVDGGGPSTVTSLSYGVGGLACGTTHAVAVDAYDAAGNRSPKTPGTLTTSACVFAPSTLFRRRSREPPSTGASCRPRRASGADRRR